MLINHTTQLSNVASIRQYGLLTSFTRQEMAAVWFHKRTRKANDWGENHVRLRHGVREDVVHITFDVPRSWLKRKAGGLWYCLRDVPASRIRKIVRIRRTVEEIAL